MKTIRITESQFRRVIKNIIDESNSTSKYPEGFSGKYSCITKQGWAEYDFNKDGIVDTITNNLTSKTYLPFGKLKFSEKGTTPTESKWYCSGDKVVDNFVKNTKFKTYKNNNPFVEDAGLRIPLNTTDNGSDGKWITNMQKKLIQLKKLNISKPTGNYGRMTQSAVMNWVKGQSDETNQTRGITKDAYNRLVNS